MSRYNSGEYGKLPPNVKFGLDDGSIVKAVCEGLELPGMSSNDFPLFVVADSFNRIIFVRKGYSINLGETLARILDAVE